MGSIRQAARDVGWAAAAAAVTDFYIVRYGLAGSRNLFHNFQVYGVTATEIRALVASVDYNFAVDAVNENGVTLSELASTV